MATILAQSISKAAGGGSVVSTLVSFEGAGAENVQLPHQSSDASGTASVAQLVRPGDTAVTVTKTDRDTVAISGGSAGLKVLLVSHSALPVTNPS